MFDINISSIWPFPTGSGVQSEDRQPNLIHVRRQDMMNQIDTRGGITIAWTYQGVSDQPGTLSTLNFGIAVCSPKDVYNKSEGRRIAVERLPENELTIQNNIFYGMDQSRIASYMRNLVINTASMITMQEIGRNIFDSKGRYIIL